MAPCPSLTHPPTLPRKSAQGRPDLLTDPSNLPYACPANQAKQPSLDLPPAGMDGSYCLWGQNDGNLLDILGTSSLLNWGEEMIPNQRGSMLSYLDENFCLSLLGWAGAVLFVIPIPSLFCG